MNPVTKSESSWPSCKAYDSLNSSGNVTPNVFSTFARLAADAPLLSFRDSPQFNRSIWASIRCQVEAIVAGFVTAFDSAGFGDDLPPVRDSINARTFLQSRSLPTSMHVFPFQCPESKTMLGSAPAF